MYLSVEVNSRDVVGNMAYVRQQGSGTAGLHRVPEPCQRPWRGDSRRGASQLDTILQSISHLNHNVSLHHVSHLLFSALASNFRVLLLDCSPEHHTIGPSSKQSSGNLSFEQALFNSVARSLDSHTSDTFSPPFSNSN